MKQVWIPRTGAPDVLEVREAPEPQPGPGELRIRVKAAGVNFADVQARLGFYPDAPKLPFVPGYEVTGIVDAAGPGADASRVGQRVIGLTRFGGYSEVVCVPEPSTFPLPESLSFAEGASLPVNWLTAWHMLVDLAHLRRGMRVLIQAAAGGVGVAAVQICRKFGAEAIGTASASKHARLRELGLTHVIDYRTQDFEAEVKRLTGGRGVHVALDAVGGASFKKSFRSLAPTGRLVMFGASAVVPGKERNVFAALKTMMGMPVFWPVPLLQHNKGIFGVNMGHLWDELDLLRGHFEGVLKGVRSGDFKPIVDLEVPLAEAARAHARLQDRANFGKVVLTT